MKAYVLLCMPTSWRFDEDLRQRDNLTIFNDHLQCISDRKSPVVVPVVFSSLAERQKSQGASTSYSYEKLF